MVRCPWCDTKYAWKKCATDIEVDNDTYEIVMNKLTAGPKLIVITGGEPIVHLSNPFFVNMLKDLTKWGYEIDIETSMLRDKPKFGKMMMVYKQFLNWHCDMARKINLIVSPKFLDGPDGNCQHYYKMDNMDLLLIGRDLRLFFKLVYNPTDRVSLINFLDNIGKGNFDKTYIMPMTPDPFDPEEYRHICQETIAFCIARKLRYTPRIQVDVFGTTRGV